MSDSESITSPHKVCSRCNQSLPATSEFFSRNSGHRDGLASNCKNCAKKYNQEYYAANRELLKARQRGYNALFREEQREYSRQYRVTHPEQVATAVRRYYETHKEAHAERRKAWEAANPAKAAASRKRWAKAHPENCRARTRKHRAAKIQNGGSHTLEDIQAQYDRQEGRCFYCHKKVGKKYHVDHVIPLAKGGSNGTENIVISCHKCNQMKADKHPMDFCGRLL